MAASSQPMRVRSDDKMADRREFLAFLAGFGSAGLLPPLEALASAPQGEIPALKEFSTSTMKVALPVKKLGGLPGRMWDKHRIWLQAGDGDGKLPASIRFSLPNYVLRRDLDRTLEILREEMKSLA